MSQIQFSPEAWSKGGQAYRDEAAALRSAVSGKVAALDVNSLGSQNGGHPIDITLAMVVPVVKDVFLEACENLAANLEAVADALDGTATSYAEFEAATADHAAQSGTL